MARFSDTASARLAALRGFSTTFIASDKDVELAKRVCYDSVHPEGSIPLQFLALSGEGKDVAALEAAVESAVGLIVALDKDYTITAAQLENFIPDGTRLQHVSLMSRHLNGEGMGFFASAAKRAANACVWDAGSQSVENYREAESALRALAEAAQATYTIVRAGTLKGGASGDTTTGGNGEASFLAPAYYKDPQMGSFTGELVYDCNALGVKLVAGDVLPGPGVTAALTATDKVGSGDSHRGAVAAALVEALRVPAAANRDFGIAAEEGLSFPTPEQWGEMFSAA